jgi:hypothetical protein
MKINFQGEVSAEDMAQFSDTIKAIDEAIKRGNINPLNIPQTVTVITDFDTAKKLYSWSEAVKPTDENKFAFDAQGRPNDRYYGYRIGVDDKNPVIFINVKNSRIDNGLMYGFTDGGKQYGLKYSRVGVFSHEVTHVLFPRTAGNSVGHDESFYLKSALVAKSIGREIDALDAGKLAEFGILNRVMEGTLEVLKLEADKCFLPHTPILLADGTTKPIEAIRPEDHVMTYDDRGILVPRCVTRVFVSDVAHVLDFHGTGVTPGHVFLCGAGRFKGRHVPLIDILRDDGAVVRQDGSLMRAATGCAVGSDADRLIEVVAAHGTTGRLRAGTRVAGETGEVTVSALIAQAGGTICDGGVALPGAPAPQPFAWAGGLPAPEDYVLRQSGVTLAGIYAADEWESPPQMAAALDFGTAPRRRPARRHRVPIFEVDRTRACL